MHLTTVILRFQVNHLSLCLCNWYCSHLTHYIPAYCLIKEQALQNHSVPESFWSTLSSMFWNFFYLKISAMVFFFLPQSWSFCGGVERPCPLSSLDGNKLEFPGGESTKLLIPLPGCSSVQSPVLQQLSKRMFPSLYLQNHGTGCKSAVHLSLVLVMAWKC